jgi:hypothetical protein
MKNQYVGSVETVEGFQNAYLFLDDDEPNEVTIHVWGSIAKPFAVVATIHIENLAGGTINLVPRLLYDVSDSGALIPASESSSTHLPLYAAELVLVDETWKGHWTKKDGASGTVEFTPVRDTEEIIPKTCESWADFKTWADTVRQAGTFTAFRGHGSNKFRLCTSLQRVGRNRLERYCAQSLPQFAAHVEAIDNVRYDLSNGDDYSTILALAQHHGLPTPLLDWTRSPYVAAFFAFIDAQESSGTRNATHVRIYGLSSIVINRTSRRSVTIPSIRPYAAILNVGPLRNPRIYAQQGLFMATNAANVEHVLVEEGKREGKDYVIAADVPIAVAADALDDLKYMGLTAATMFPGLDGVCRMMKQSMYSRTKLRVVADEKR